MSVFGRVPCSVFCVVVELASNILTFLVLELLPPFLQRHLGLLCETGDTNQG